jgi:hypothetical protein
VQVDNLGAPLQGFLPMAQAMQAHGDVCAEPSLRRAIADADADAGLLQRESSTSVRRLGMLDANARAGTTAGTIARASARNSDPLRSPQSVEYA